MRLLLSALLGCILLSTPLQSKAQAINMACPIPIPVANWPNTDVSTLMISSFSGNVRIDGTFTVDDDFTLDGAEVAIGTNGSIVVLPGFTLRIINNSTLTNLQAAWQGITVEPGAFLEIEDSDVCGAVTAIEADNGFAATAGSIEIINSGLRFNHTGIQVERYSAAAYPAFVVGTHFEGGTLPIGAPTASSYQGVRAFQIDGGSGLTIGGVNTTWAANQFTDMELGIDVQGSSLQAYNNAFERIQPNTVAGNGVAIRALPNPSGPFGVYVGTSANRANTMLDCRIGVQTEGMQIVQVMDNIMAASTSPFEFGIEVTETQDMVVVSGNDIQEFSAIGVFLDEHPGSPSTFTDASINNNEIIGTFGTSQGVFVDEFIGGLRIRDNIPIDQVARGVTVQNAIPSGPMAGMRVDGNNITFGYPGATTTTSPAVGVLMVDVDEPWIDNNTITGNCNFPGGGICTTNTANNSRIRGIQVEQTTAALIFKNTIAQCGGGLVVKGRNAGGNVLCNEFFDCYSGVVWSEVNLIGSFIDDDFGVLDAGLYKVYGTTAPDASSENRWTSPVTGFEPIRSFAINTSGADEIDWFFRPAATYNFPPLTNLNDGASNALTINPGSATPICSLLPLTDGGGSEGTSASMDWDYLEPNRQSRFSSLSGQPIDGMEQSDYAFLESAFANGTTNPVTQAILARTDIPMLFDLERNWRSMPISEFATNVSSLTPATEQERAYEILWQMRLDRVLDSEFEQWSTEDLDALRSIATASWQQVGGARSTAQSMLNVALVEDDWAVEDEALRTASTDPDPKPSVWPNPAGNAFSLMVEEEAQEISIMNSLGQVVFNTSIVQATTVSIDCSRWPTGVYWVIQTGAAGQVFKEALCIQR